MENYAEYSARKKSLSMAIGWWFILGTFGAHRFYMGKPVSAFCILLLPFFICALLFLNQPEGAVALFTFYLLWLIADLFWCISAVKKHNLLLLKNLEQPSYEEIFS